MLMHVPLNQLLHYRKLARRNFFFSDYEILNVFVSPLFFYYRTVSNSMSTTEDPNNAINPPEESSFPLYVMCYCLRVFFFVQQSFNFSWIFIIIGVCCLIGIIVVVVVVLRKKSSNDRPVQLNEPFSPEGENYC
jgi:hypothetical protein